MDDDAALPDPTTTDDGTAVDPIDVEAAEIDARSPDAPEQIAELIEDADRLGRDTTTADPTSTPTSTPTPDDG